MPELPDVTVYVEALSRRLRGHVLDRVRIASPSLLRTVDPAITDAFGARVEDVHRRGKRIVLGFDPDLFLVLHLMIAGRLRWLERGARITPKGLAAFDFDNGTLLLTEASSRKRASLHVVRGEAGLERFTREGIEPLAADLASFAEALRRENHTLKRALTDPDLFSGIGNAYSDEILHHARLSPLRLSRTLTDDEVERLFAATRQTLTDWIQRLRKEAGDGFPVKVTAFRPEMAVHGRYRKPCPVCGSPVQRIVYAENEANYCPTCQTGGKLLADRGLSRILRSDWPRTLEELEERLPRGLKTDAAESRRRRGPVPRSSRRTVRS
jgi:formamidopyrimidine-DNA glycosylase